VILGLAFTFFWPALPSRYLTHPFTLLLRVASQKPWRSFPFRTREFVAVKEINLLQEEACVLWFQFLILSGNFAVVLHRNANLAMLLWQVCTQEEPPWVNQDCFRYKYYDFASAQTHFCAAESGSNT
jgi:hypothetical protein